MKTCELVKSGLILFSAMVLNGCGGGNNGGTTISAVDSLGQIRTRMNSFTRCVQQKCSSLASYLSSDFMLDGMNAAAYLKQLSSTTNPVAADDYFLLNLATVFDNSSQSNAAPDSQWFNSTQYNASGMMLGQSRLKFVNMSGIWYLAGNERKVRVNLRAESAMTNTTLVPASFSSDINITVDPVTAATGIGIVSAMVSGLEIVSASSDGILIYSNLSPATLATAALSNLIPVCDQVIVDHCTKALDGSQYHITLLDSSGKTVTYVEVLNKAPLPATGLTATMFPSVSSISPSTISEVIPAGAMTMLWNNPPGLISNWADFTVWDSNGQLVFQISEVPAGNSFSATLPSFTPPTNGVSLSRINVNIQAADAYGRQYILFN